MTRRRYAEGTSVPAEKSRAEIETALTRFGCDQFMSGWESGGKAAVAFRKAGRFIRILVPMPDRNGVEFVHPKIPGRDAFATYRRNSDEKRQALWEQACRERWRAALLVVKARIEAIELGFSTFEREFLADTVLPDGQTVADLMEPQIENAYSSGAMPRGILMLTTGSPDVTDGEVEP